MPNDERLIRLDMLLLELGLASTRTKAQELIAAGKVSVNGRVVQRAGEKVSFQSEISLSEPEHPYVSRGGLKLGAALEGFALDVNGLRALDVGQSTGGFTHCLLLRGAASVVGVDVGTGQLAEELRKDTRVTFLEKQDVRELDPESVAPRFDFFVVDLSFVSLTKILPSLPPFLSGRAQGLVLVKPQFEVGPAKVGSGGIVRDAAAREGAVDSVKNACRTCGFTVAGVLPSPIAGGDGNQEVFLHLLQASQGGAF
ncbi:MAG TPA: TlyA family RNA methyltransferase [Bdellovibrionota bacterium]|jgi:23S rRNA (cytidine1920-2'-O)/16S rRNA (cytidine1409-2'-O)-methyltransferase